MDCVRRPCFESVSTIALSSSRIALSSSILDCSEVKMAGSTLGEDVAEAAELAMVVSSPDIVAST